MNLCRYDLNLIAQSRSDTALFNQSIWLDQLVEMMTSKRDLIDIQLPILTSTLHEIDVDKFGDSMSPCLDSDDNVAIANIWTTSHILACQSGWFVFWTAHRNLSANEDSTTHPSMLCSMIDFNVYQRQHRSIEQCAQVLKIFGEKRHFDASRLVPTVLWRQY